FGNEPGLQEHFGNPLLAFYSLFKVFTVEGWYEIPDQVARSGGSAGLIFMIRMYFMLSVLVGGLLGLSMANAVFVDEMTADNNDRLEQMVENLHGELQQFREEMRRTQTRL
ncbi:MAG: ion transporter, partial [Rhodothermales bacterium]